MRRSSRLQCQKFRKSGKEEAVEWVTNRENEDPPGLAVRTVSKEIGLGLFAEKNFSAGDFIVEYAGKVCSAAEGDWKYDQTFLFYFTQGRRKLCIDASSSQRKGKFINDEWNQPNAYVEKHLIDERPRLLIFARRDISAGSEIRYDYGKKNAPWRKKDQGLSSTVKLPVATVSDREDEDEEQDISSTPVRCTFDDDTDMEDVEENDQGLSSTVKLPVAAVSDREDEDEEQDIPSTSVKCTFDDDTDMEAVEENDQGLSSTVKLPVATVSDREDEDEEQDISSTPVGCTFDDDTDMEDVEENDQGLSSTVKLPVAAVSDREDEDEEQDISSTPVRCTFDDDTDMEAVEENDQGLSSTVKLPVAAVSDREDEDEEQDIPSTSVRCTFDDDTDMEAVEENDQGLSSTVKLPVAAVSDREDEDEDWWSEDSENDSEYKPDYSDDETCSYTSESQENNVSSLQEDESQCKELPREENCCADVIVSPATSTTMEKRRCDQSDNSHGIEVQVTSNENGQRCFDKKFPCFFCTTKTTQIQRHFRDQHSDEAEVQAITSETDPKERSKKMTLLRNRGIHSHNCKVIRDGKGILIVSYRPTLPSSHKDYGPCDFCLGYYVRTDLWKHSCELRPNHSKKAHQERPAVSCKFLMPVGNDMSQGLHEVTSLMISDRISRVAKSDPLIVDLAERQYATQGHDKDQHSAIRTKMRESARLLIELRTQTKNENAGMKEFIHPKHFRVVVAAVQKVSCYNEQTQQYGIPSLALKLGHTLKKMSLVCCGKASEEGDNDLYLQAQRFAERCQSDWSVFVSSNALRTIHENKRNKVKLLPLTEDVAALTNLLKEKGRKCAKVLEEYQKENETQDREDACESWRELNEVALSQIMLFNRRRQGEVSKMKVKDVEEIKDVQKDPNVMTSLSSLEQQLCSQLSRVEVVGKRGRTVPVLMNSEMKCWVNLLLETRHEVALVHPENEFVFARSFYASKGHIRGSDCLRKYAYLCDAKNPSSLTGTNLRKQLATLCQLLNLKENEMDMIANYLGHDLRVHREYYRLPMEVMQVAKVSKLLIAMEKGGRTLCKGQNLDDLAVCDDELEESSEEQEHTEDEETPLTVTENDDVDHMMNTEDAVNHVHGPKKQKKVAQKEAATGKSKKYTKHRPWTSEERQAVKRHLHHLLVLNQLPGKKAIEECIQKETSLSKRSWKNVKDFCRNLMKSMKL